MIREFAQRMMDADVEVACNAGYGEVTPDRVNSRNGYRFAGLPWERLDLVLPARDGRGAAGWIQAQELAQVEDQGGEI